MRYFALFQNIGSTRKNSTTRVLAETPANAPAPQVLDAATFVMLENAYSVQAIIKDRLLHVDTLRMMKAVPEQELLRWIHDGKPYSQTINWGR